jgi:hypothetical protein
MPAKSQKREGRSEIEEVCSWFGTFIETRYNPRKIPAGPERQFYHLHCFCGMIDSDGMACLLAQPEADRRGLYRSARILGLTKLVENAQAAATALRQSGLSLKREGDREAITEVLKPFEKRYYDQLRDTAFARMHRLLISCDVFIPYGLNCQRMEEDGGNPFDPKEWTPEKIRSLGGL